MFFASQILEVICVTKQFSPIRTMLGGDKAVTNRDKRKFTLLTLEQPSVPSYTYGKRLAGHI